MTIAPDSEKAARRKSDPGKLLFVTGLLIILIAGLATRGPSLGKKSLWVDEVTTARLSLQGMGPALAYARKDVTPPLFYIFTSLAARFGDSETLLRLPAFLFGLLGLGLIVWAGIVFLNRPMGGLVAGFLLLISPFHLYHSQDARMYSQLIALTVLALGCEDRFWAAWRRGGRFERRPTAWLAGWTLATLLNLYTSYFAFFVLFGQGLSILYRLGRSRSKPGLRILLLAWAIAAVVLWLGYLPWLGATFDFLNQYGGDSMEKTAPPGLKTLALTFQVFGPQSAFGGLLFAALALAGLFYSGRLARLFVFQLIGPTLYLAVSSPSHFFAPRYLAFLLPVYLLLVAAGLLNLSRWLRLSGPCLNLRQTLFAIFSGIVLLAASWSALDRYYRLEKQNWREAVAFLASHLQAGDRIMTGKNGVDYGVLYYLRRQRPTFPVEFLPRIKTAEQVEEQIERPGRIWFIHAWRKTTSSRLLLTVYDHFHLMGSYPAMNDWGEIYIFLRE